MVTCALNIQKTSIVTQPSQEPLSQQTLAYSPKLTADIMKAMPTEEEWKEHKVIHTEIIIHVYGIII